MRPNQKMRFPNVSLASLPVFEKSLDTWFGRKNIPIWITEYGHETKPDRRGITLAKQRAYASQALAIARKDPRVEMFVWFILQDHSKTPWESGLVTEFGVKKPAFASFAAMARAVDARNAVVEVNGTNPLVRVSALPLGYYSAAGDTVGVNWELWNGVALVGRGVPASPLQADGWIAFRPDFTPQPGRTYVLYVKAHTASGVWIERTLTLVAPKPARRR